MERQIIFRGKRKDNNEWVYGDLIHYSENDYRILPQNERNWDILESGYEVIPETVGQYTGLRNKNKVKIFEGDILKITNIPNGYTPSGLVIVTWGKKANGWKLKCNIDNQWVKLKYYSLPSSIKMEIIGNTTDNPELINNKQN